MMNMYVMEKLTAIKYSGYLYSLTCQSMLFLMYIQYTFSRLSFPCHTELRTVVVEAWCVGHYNRMLVKCNIWSAHNKNGNKA